MHSRLTKEGRAVRNGSLRVIGWLTAITIGIGSLALICRGAGPTVTSWFQSASREAMPPPVLAATPQRSVPPPAQPQPPAPQVRYERVYVPVSGERIERHYFFQTSGTKKKDSKETPKAQSTPTPRTEPAKKPAAAPIKEKPPIVGPLPAPKPAKKPPPQPPPKTDKKK